MNKTLTRIPLINTNSQARFSRLNSRPFALIRVTAACQPQPSLFNSRPFALIRVTAALLFLCASALNSVAAQTNLLTAKISDYGLALQTRKNATLTLLWPNPRTDGVFLIRQDPVSSRSDTNGAIWFTNILWGRYRLDIEGLSGTKFPLYVGTNTVGTVQLASLVTNSAALPPNNGTNYYTIAQVDAILAAAVSGGGLSNYVNTASSSGIGIATNTSGLLTLYTLSLYGIAASNATDFASIAQLNTQSNQFNLTNILVATTGTNYFTLYAAGDTNANQSYYWNSTLSKYTNAANGYAAADLFGIGLWLSLTNSTGEIYLTYPGVHYLRSWFTPSGGADGTPFGVLENSSVRLATLRDMQGQSNTIASSFTNSMILGGSYNSVFGIQSAIVGGDHHSVNAQQSAIVGGNYGVIDSENNTKADMGQVGSEASLLRADCSVTAGVLYGTNTAFRNTVQLGSWKPTLADAGAGNTSFGVGQLGIYESIMTAGEATVQLAAKHSTNIYSVRSFHGLGGQQTTNNFSSAFIGRGIRAMNNTNTLVLGPLLTLNNATNTALVGVPNSSIRFSNDTANVTGDLRATGAYHGTVGATNLTGTIDNARLTTNVLTATDAILASKTTSNPFAYWSDADGGLNFTTNLNASALTGTFRGAPILGGLTNISGTHYIHFGTNGIGIDRVAGSAAISFDAQGIINSENSYRLTGDATLTKVSSGLVLANHSNWKAIRSFANTVMVQCVTNSRVGILTESPTTTLDVRGEIGFGASATNVLSDLGSLINRVGMTNGIIQAAFNFQTNAPPAGFTHGLIITNSYGEAFQLGGNKL